MNRDSVAIRYLKAGVPVVNVHNGGMLLFISMVSLLRQLMRLLWALVVYFIIKNTVHG